MRFATFCSGVEAVSLAVEPLGFSPVFFSQYDPDHDYTRGPDFASAVLAERWPNIPNLGDMTNFEKFQEVRKHGPTIDFFAAGTPCQSYSVAGSGGGLADSRGELALVYLDHIGAFRPRWFLWENVAGVLQTNNGRDFGAIVGKMAELGYGVAYRVFDAQFFGVAQQRRRVFVVGFFGAWQPAAAVLFERESLSWNTSPRGKSGYKTAAAVNGSTTGSGGSGSQFLGMQETVGTLCADTHPGGYSGQDAYTNRLIPALLPAAFAQNERDEVRYIAGDGSVIGSLAADHGAKQKNYIHDFLGVRRLTPIECERLQGMPENHTRISWRGRPAEECPEGLRMRAIGNAMAVPVVRWIAERIAVVDQNLKG